MTRLILPLLALLGLAAAGCSDGSASQAGENGPGSLRLPSQVVGLRVQQEDITEELESVNRPYVDGVGVFSFRDDDLLRATLQVAHFNRLARPDDASFRRSVLATIGGRAPAELQIEGTTVTVTGASEQDVFAWFEGDSLLILGVAQDFEFPRTLLRRILQLDLRV